MVMTKTPAGSTSGCRPYPFGERWNSVLYSTGDSAIELTGAAVNTWLRERGSLIFWVKCLNPRRMADSAIPHFDSVHVLHYIISFTYYLPTQSGNQLLFPPLPLPFTRPFTPEPRRLQHTPPTVPTPTKQRDHPTATKVKSISSRSRSPITSVLHTETRRYLHRYQAYPIDIKDEQRYVVLDQIRWRL